MPTDVAPKVHASLGASVASRWMACPGSNQLIERSSIPPTTSVHAQAGTAAHAVAEMALRKGVDPDMWLGMTVEGVEVDDEMVEAVRVFTDICASLTKAAKGKSWIEQRFNLAPLNPPGPMFGTADFVAIVADSLYVVDFKYGQGVVVEAENNAQLRYYALGAMLSLPKGTRIETVYMSIVQPRALHPDGPHRESAMSVDELLAFSADLIAAAKATTAPDAPLAAGKHCRWCPASGGCPAQHQQAQSIAQVEFAAMPLDRPRAPETLTDEELAKVLGLLPILDDWTAAVKAYAYAKLERGDVIPGQKLVAKRATRKWSDVEKAMQAAVSAHDAEDVTEPPRLKSPAQLEKITGKKYFEAWLAQYTVKQSSGLTMVPATDPRPGVSLTAGSEFPLLGAGSPATTAETGEE